MKILDKDIKNEFLYVGGAAYVMGWAMKGFGLLILVVLGLLMWYQKNAK